MWVPDVEGFSFVGFEIVGDVCFDNSVEFFFFVLGAVVWNKKIVTFEMKLDIEDFEEMGFGFGEFGFLDFGSEEFLPEALFDDVLFLVIWEDFDGVGDFLEPGWVDGLGFFKINRLELGVGGVRWAESVGEEGGILGVMEVVHWGWTMWWDNN